MDGETDRCEAVVGHSGRVAELEDDGGEDRRPVALASTTTDN